jgi:hypothetical protein
MEIFSIFLRNNAKRTCNRFLLRLLEDLIAETYFIS